MTGAEGEWQRKRETEGGREREKHLTLKGEMLVKFKPYLICDTLVNNCPRRALAVFTCHQGQEGGGLLQGVAR